jgi:NADH dehydrogenase
MFVAAALAELPGKVLPIAPALTTDQVTMLKSDNVPADGMAGLKALGVADPQGVEAILPTYLYRFRKGGQFAEAPMLTSTGADF